MSYELFALIGREAPLWAFAAGLPAKIIPLSTDVFLLPLVGSLAENFKAASGRDAKSAAKELEYLYPAMVERALEASQHGMLAYVEAEYFGGQGGQSAVVWDQGSTLKAPFWEPNAINTVLRMMGVQPAPQSDEFDAVGLGRHRKTEQW